MAEENQISTMTCTVCLEDVPTTRMVKLSKCSHENCKHCLKKWVEHQESFGNNAVADCPFCRTVMSNEDVVKILSRAFGPGNRHRPAVNTHEAMDSLTADWLTSHTRQCPRCRAHIEKRSGCDMMTCRCGHLFCYGCGSSGCRCSCWWPLGQQVFVSQNTSSPRDGFMNACIEQLEELNVLMYQFGVATRRRWGCPSRFQFLNVIMNVDHCFYYGIGMLLNIAFVLTLRYSPRLMSQVTGMIWRYFSATP